MADLAKGIMALESKVTYIITGPCTTFALLSKVFPEVLTKIDRVMIMGSGFEMGNITPHAEFNTYCDPESLEVVVNCPIETIVYPLEPLDYVSFNAHTVQKVKNHPSPFSWMLGEMYDQLEYSYRKECGENGIDAVSYDSGLIPALVRRDYVKMSPCNLKVLKDGEKRGKTTYTLVETSDCNSYVATWCDKIVFDEMLFECMDLSCGMSKPAKGKRAIEDIGIYMDGIQVGKKLKV